MHVSLIGLGHMGMAMGHNLVAAGHEVAAWNRSPIDAAKLGGVRVLASPAEAFQADAVLTMLSDDTAIRATILDSRALQGARADLVHVVMSTISVAFAEELSARHAEAGVAYVSAPVLGRPRANSMCSPPARGTRPSGYAPCSTSPPRRFGTLVKNRRAPTPQ